MGEVIKAGMRGDVAFLKEVCSGARPADPPMKTRACQEVDKQAARATASNESCDGAVERYRATTTDSVLAVEQFGKVLARCGQTDVVFEEVATWGLANEGWKILETIDDAQVAPGGLSAAFGKYLSAHKGAQLMGTKKPAVAFSNATQWLSSRKHVEHCPVLAVALVGAPSAMRMASLTFFSETKCVEAAPIGLEALASDDANNRAWGCRLLGDVGTKSTSPRLEVLAARDPYFVERQAIGEDGRVHVTRDYQVRTACEDAVTRLKARGQ
jgi:hypothetical protein